jgi:drug/metabolite transporter (DMT)-like permease
MQSLWMLLASLLFACMGVCVKLAAATHSAVEITFYRSFISLILMFALVRLQGVSLVTPHWRWHISRGVVGLFGAVRLFLRHYPSCLWQRPLRSITPRQSFWPFTLR